MTKFVCFPSEHYVRIELISSRDTLYQWHVFLINYIVRRTRLFHADWLIVNKWERQTDRQKEAQAKNAMITNKYILLYLLIFS